MSKPFAGVNSPAIVLGYGLSADVSLTGGVLMSCAVDARARMKMPKIIIKVLRALTLIMFDSRSLEKKMSRAANLSGCAALFWRNYSLFVAQRSFDPLRAAAVALIGVEAYGLPPSMFEM